MLAKHSLNLGNSLNCKIMSTSHPAAYFRLALLQQICKILLTKSSLLKNFMDTVDNAKG